MHIAWDSTVGRSKLATLVGVRKPAVEALVCGIPIIRNVWLVLAPAAAARNWLLIVILVGVCNWNLHMHVGVHVWRLEMVN